MAQELSEVCDLVLRHCGEPMRWRGVATRWEGRPGEGLEISTFRYACTCGAEAEVRLAEVR